MARIPAVLLLLALVAAAALAVGIRPAAAQQFSADLVNSGSAGAAAGRTQKIYVSDGKIRMEGAAMKGGALLADANAKSVIMLMAQQKAYMEMPQMGDMARAFIPVDPNDPCPQWQEMAESARRSGAAGAAAEGPWSCKRVGPEQVNGRSTVKYEATSPKGEQHFGWIDPKLKFMVKSQSPQGHVMELRNIQEGPQQAGLFEVPAGYQKMDMGEMMKRMMPQGGAKPPG